MNRQRQSRAHIYERSQPRVPNFRKPCLHKIGHKLGSEVWKDGGLTEVKVVTTAMQMDATDFGRGAPVDRSHRLII